MILTSDLHLVDGPSEEYRWAVFDHLIELIERYDDTKVFILGDLCDRKDRHSAELVNRILDQFSRINLATGATIHCLLGNHDKPLTGTPYWEILNHTGFVEFITAPTLFGYLILLPYTHTPSVDWQDIDFTEVKAVFMHQTVSGAVANNGHVLEAADFPGIPSHVKVYSGDIHTPQVIGNVTYVGAPHHVKFGDDYPCRILRLDDDFNIISEHYLNPPKKQVVSIKAFEDLAQYDISPGDQLRVKVELPQENLDSWPEFKRRITRWSQRLQVTIASVEAEIMLTKTESGPTQAVQLPTTPREILAEYGKSAGLDAPLIAEGLRLLDLYHAGN